MAANATPHFSWADTFHIVFSSCSTASSSCFQCLRRVPSDDSLHNHGTNDRGFNPAINRIPRARPDELQGLLADPSSSDTEAERLSLHSNPGRGRVRRKRKSKRGSKKISLFGFDLFGSRNRPKPPPIHLPDDDDALYGHASDSQGGSSSDLTGSAQPPRRKKRGHGAETPAPTILTATTSIATFDSDAAPLSASVIEELSSSGSAAALLVAAEEKARKEKEERRRRHHERKAQRELRERMERERLVLEKLKQQGILPEAGNGEEFEGFQGSGSAIPAPPLGALLSQRSATTVTSSTSDSASRTGSGSRYSGREGFDKVVKAGSSIPPSSPAPFVESHNPNDEADAADLDGAFYSTGTRRPNPHYNGSDSRSRTSRISPPLSASSQQAPQPLPSVHHHDEPLGATVEHHSGPSDKPKKKKKKHGHSSATTASGSRTHSSTTSTSQSLSIASPTSAGFSVGLGPEIADYQPHKTIGPTTVEQGLGFFDVDDLPPSPPFDANLHGRGLGKSEARGGFPMAGFGHGGGGRKARDVALLLARRGDDVEGEF